MCKTNVVLEPLVQGGFHTDIRYLVCAMQIILEAGKFPKNLCRLVAEQEKATVPAVRKGFSRIGKIIWENSGGELRQKYDSYPGPINIFHDLAYIISDGAIL